MPRRLVAAHTDFDGKLPRDMPQARTGLSSEMNSYGLMKPKAAEKAISTFSQEEKGQPIDDASRVCLVHADNALNRSRWT